MGYVEKGRYSRLLRDGRWAAKREEIISRDERMCRRCGEGEPLDVHHIRYPRSGVPWEMGNEMLLSLCRECHREESANRPEEERELLDELAKICLYAEDVRAVRTAIRAWIQAIPKPNTRDAFSLADCILLSRTGADDEDEVWG